MYTDLILRRSRSSRARLEGWMRARTYSVLRDASLRDAPQDEVDGRRAMGLLYFEQHAFRFENSLVILDIDGTLVPDCGRIASAAVVEKVLELKAQGNEVRLCSNSRRGNYAQRLAALATQLEVGVCPVVFRKPSTLAIAGLDRKGRQL